MNNAFIPFEKVQKMYPDEWVLLGNPEITNTKVLGGVLVYHSKDKKEVCYIGRHKTKAFSKVIIAFTGDLKQHRKIGILRRLSIRKDWATAFKKMAKNGDDSLVLPDVFNDDAIPDWV